MPRTKGTPAFWRTFSRKVQPVTVIHPDGTRETLKQTFHDVEQIIEDGENGVECAACGRSKAPSDFRNRKGDTFPWCRACRTSWTRNRSN